MYVLVNVTSYWMLLLSFFYILSFYKTFILQTSFIKLALYYSLFYFQANAPKDENNKVFLPLQLLLSVHV